ARITGKLDKGDVSSYKPMANAVKASAAYKRPKRVPSGIDKWAKLTTDGDYNQVIGANLSYMLDQGYFDQYYSGKGTLPKGITKEDKLKRLRENINIFRTLTAKIQAMKRNPDLWTDPKSGFQELLNKQHQYLAAILPEYVRGADFRRAALIYKYGDKDLVNKFGPEIYDQKTGKSTNAPARYAEVFKQAVAREQKEGAPKLTGKEINKLLGVTGVVSTATLNMIGKAMGMSDKEILGWKLKKESLGGEAFKKLLFQAFKRFGENPSAKGVGVPIKHQGGYTEGTGLYYLEGGELIVPRKYSTGGPVSFENVMKQSDMLGSAPQINISADDITSKITEAISSAMGDAIDDMKNIKLEVDEDSRKLEFDAKEAGSTLSEQVTSALENVNINVDIDESKLADIGKNIGNDIADTVKKIEVPVKFDKDSLNGVSVPIDKSNLEGVTVEAKLNESSLNALQQSNNGNSVGADRVDNLTESINGLTEAYYATNEKITEVAEKVTVLNDDVTNIKDNTITTETVNRIVEEGVNLHVNKLYADLNSTNSTTDSIRSQVAQIKGQIDHIDSKYEAITGNLLSQTHSTIA
ncbi:MAG: hypothetical protein DRO87_10285, partial [Candidatus Thorarchaeota archaeon]